MKTLSTALVALLAVTGAALASAKVDTRPTDANERTGVDAIKYHLDRGLDPFASTELSEKLRSPSFRDPRNAKRFWESIDSTRGGGDQGL